MRQRWVYVLFAFVWLGAAAELAAGPSLTGLVRAELSPSWPSFLGVNLDELEASVCGASSTPRGAILVITNDGGGSSPLTFGVAVVDLQPGPRGSMLASVVPVALNFVGPEPLSFDCGSFRYRLVLDAHVQQPISILTLVPSSTSQGTAAGVLEIEAVLQLEPLGYGAVFQQSQSLALRIAARYVMLDGQVVQEGDSPLVLFARKVQGVLEAAPERVMTDDPNTSIYLQAPSSALEHPTD